MHTMKRLIFVYKLYAHEEETDFVYKLYTHDEETDFVYKLYTHDDERCLTGYTGEC